MPANMSYIAINTFRLAMLNTKRMLWEWIDLSWGYFSLRWIHYSCPDSSCNWSSSEENRCWQYNITNWEILWWNCNQQTSLLELVTPATSGRNRWSIRSVSSFLTPRFTQIVPIRMFHSFIVYVETNPFATYGSLATKASTDSLPSTEKINSAPEGGVKGPPYMIEPSFK